MKKLSVFLAIVAVAVCGQSEVVKITLPQETAKFKTAPGSDLANAQCLTCHSAEYVSSQPPLSRTFWKSSVDKMVGKYGAPVPADQVEPLVDYLAMNYGTETKPSAPQIQVAATGDIDSLVNRAGCLNCHAEDKKIGPNFKDVAKKYAGKSEGVAKVTHQISNGGAGQWGSIPMPAFTQLSDSEVKNLADWVLSQK